MVAAVASGITPAWAGKRPLKTPIMDDMKDYPRVGGEEQAAEQSAQ